MCVCDVQFASMNITGQCVAVAGKCGLAHCTLYACKWKLFGNETQARVLFRCSGYPVWFRLARVSAFKQLVTCTVVMSELCRPTFLWSYTYAVCKLTKLKNTRGTNTFLCHTTRKTKKIRCAASIQISSSGSGRSFDIQCYPVPDTDFKNFCHQLVPSFILHFVVWNGVRFGAGGSRVIGVLLTLLLAEVKYSGVSLHCCLPGEVGKKVASPWDFLQFFLTIDWNFKEKIYRHI